MMYMGLKGAAIALRGTSFVCGKCADGLDATAALARGAAGATGLGEGAERVDPSTGELSRKAATQASVDINTASVSELQSIANIDEARATEIVRARETEPFESIDQLGRIPGIGAKRIEEIKSEGVAVVG
jgi:competence ComEA-like helix-hairpin-helix protein